MQLAVDLTMFVLSSILKTGKIIFKITGNYIKDWLKLRMIL